MFPKKSLLFKFISVLALVLFLVLSGVSTNQGDSEVQTYTEEGRVLATVERVIDGDTVLVDIGGKQERIRLLLIDTPETVHPDIDEPEPFGEEATEFAKSLMSKGDEVIVEFDVNRRDKYDRLLGYLWIEGELFNKRIVEEGLARVAFVFEPNTKHLRVLESAEDKAREERLGIWSVDGYVTEYGFDLDAFE